MNPLDDRPSGTQMPAQQWILVSETACALAESADAGRGRAADAQDDLRDARVGIRRALANQSRGRRSAVRRHLALVFHSDRRIRSDYRGGGLQAGHRAARTGVEHGASRPGFPTSHDTNFPRAPAAGRAGLHGAFGFPILRGSTVLAVMEFFAREVRQPDPDLLGMLARSAARSACSSTASAPKRSSIGSSPSRSISSASPPSTGTSRA